jgi:VIT1/CCC1 family predicted Fe2+/Mn2+ transporter
VEHSREKEIDEVKAIFAEYGIDDAGQTQLANQLALDKTKWVEFMMKHELGLDEPNPKRARNASLTIGLSYFFGGMLPLSSYFFTTSPLQGLQYSAGVTLVGLFLFGYFKSKITGQPKIIGAIKVTLIGFLAAAAAYFVALYIGEIL